MSARTGAAARTGATQRRSIINIPNSLEFNGTTSVVDFGAGTFFDSTQTFALEIRFNADTYYGGTGTGTNGLLSFKTDQGVPWVIYTNKAATNGIIFGANSIFARVRPSVPITSVLDVIWRGWVHLVVIFDGVDRSLQGSYKIFLNGTQVSQISLGSAITATTHLNTLGALGTTSFFNGAATRLRVWNGGTAMTVGQVTDLFFRDIKPASGPTLAHEYLFTEGSGPSVADSAGSATGTITAGAWTAANVPRKLRTVAAARTAI